MRVFLLRYMLAELLLGKVELDAVSRRVGEKQLNLPGIRYLVFNVLDSRVIKLVFKSLGIRTSKCDMVKCGCGLRRPALSGRRFCKV